MKLGAGPLFFVCPSDSVLQILLSSTETLTEVPGWVLEYLKGKAQVSLFAEVKENLSGESAGLRKPELIPQGAGSS